MAKNQHIVAVQTALPAFTGFKRCDPFEALNSEDVVIGFRPNLEELDPREVMQGGKATLQLIPYILIRDGEEHLVYVRPAAGNETRLHGKVSIGLGGHVDIEDVIHKDSVLDLKGTIKLAGTREVEEETGGILGNADIDWIGLIYRDDGPVDRVHLGVVGVIDLDFGQRDDIGYSKEIGEFAFKGLEEIPRAYADYEVEAWSKAIIEEAA